MLRSAGPSQKNVAPLRCFLETTPDMHQALYGGPLKESGALVGICNCWAYPDAAAARRWQICCHQQAKACLNDR